MSWFRINRWWLLALPVSMAIVVGGSAQRVKDWYDDGLHHQVASADPGDTLTATVDFDDLNGSTSRQFSVRLDRLKVLRQLPPVGGETTGEVPPSGEEVLELDLQWKADPTQVLEGCAVELVDDHGRRYGVADSGAAQCVPANHPGPLSPAAEGDPRGQAAPGTERPATWYTAPTYVVPRGIKVTQVRISWSAPDYVALRTS